MPSLQDRDMVRRQAEEFETASLRDILAWAWETFGERAAFGTSFQGAGLVAMHTAYTNGFRFPVFTIDTGLLFPETLKLKAEVLEGQQGGGFDFDAHGSSHPSA